MKKLIIFAILGVMVSPLMADWNFVSSLFVKEVKPMSYTIDTSGKNLRAYEFVTQMSPHRLCVVVLRSDTRTSPAMNCQVISDKKYTEIAKKLK